MFGVAFVCDFPQRIQLWFRQTKTHSLIKVSKILAKPKCFARKKSVLSRKHYSMECKHECQVKMQPAFYWNGQKFLQPFQCYSQPTSIIKDKGLSSSLLLCPNLSTHSHWLSLLCHTVYSRVKNFEYSIKHSVASKEMLTRQRLIFIYPWWGGKKQIFCR